MNSIRFSEILPKTGDYYTGLFEVNGRDIKIGVSDTLLSIWHIQKTPPVVALFINQFGTYKIMQMLAEDNLNDYTFVSHHFRKIEDDIERTMTLGELEEYLKDKILNAEKSKEECPKCHSKKVKISGPYADTKDEYQPAEKGPVTIYYFCWDCKFQWTEQV